MSDIEAQARAEKIIELAWLLSEHLKYLGDIKLHEKIITILKVKRKREG